MAKKKKPAKKPTKKPALRKKPAKKPASKKRPKPPIKPKARAEEPSTIAISAMSFTSFTTAPCTMELPDGSPLPFSPSVDVRVFVDAPAASVLSVNAAIVPSTGVPTDPLSIPIGAFSLLRSSDPTRWTGSLPVAGPGDFVALAWPIVIADRCSRAFTMTSTLPPTHLIVEV